MGVNSSSSLEKIASLLLRDTDDAFLAWMLACFVPFAEMVAKAPEKSKSKKLEHPASLAAQEGIKADKKIFKIVDNAISNREEIIRLKDEVNFDSQPSIVPSKRKQTSSSRESQGQAIRRWGTHWRSSVLYALLTEMTKTESLTGMYIPAPILNPGSLW